MSNWQENLRKGLTGAVTVAAGAVSRAAEVAKDLAEDLTSFKALKDYKLAGHVATAGPGNTWRIFKAVNKKPGAVFPEASVWILDKKGLTDQASRSGRARGYDTFFEQQRRSCNQMLRIKHPGVVKILEPLEETNAQMVIVTEPVFGSLHNLLTQFSDVPTAPDDRPGVSLSPLEMKYGLYYISETLQFLHHEAKLAHCNLNPGCVVITRDGGWKLCGFEYVATIAEFGGPGNAGVTFEYASACPSPWEEYSQPRLSYTAPELVGGSLASSDVNLSGAADCFSLALVAHQLITGKQILHVGSSTGEYRSRLSSLSSADMSGVAANLQPLLRAMLSPQSSARPNAAAFAGCQWFSEDMLLRCLQFLDNILQRDSGQKVAFLKDLLTFWQQFDDRLLQHRILPPIVQEMRNDMVALAALPVVLAIMGRMKPEGFAASGILPVLKPIFENADGEVLLALARHLSVFYSLMPSDAHGSVLVPLMLRAFDSNNTRAQEETLKALQKLAPDMPYQLLRESLMPRVIGLCLRTTSLVVRTSSLTLMAQAAHRLDKEAAGAMLDVCTQIVAVDRSAGTAMAVLRLGDAIGKHYGPEVTAVKVLPLLCPVLVSPGLNQQQFSTFISTIHGLIDAVSEKTGGSLAAAAEAAAGALGTPTHVAGASMGSAAAAAGNAGGGHAGTASGPASTDWSRSSSGLVGSSSGNGPSGPSTPAWDTAVLPSRRSSGSSAPVAAAATNGSAWSAATWNSSSVLGNSSSSSSWAGGPNSVGRQQQQQQQCRPPAVGSSGVTTVAAVPDIFSSQGTAGGSSMGLDFMVSGLSMISQQQQQQQQQQQPSWSLGNHMTASNSNAISNGVHGPAGQDMFGGLAVSGSSSSSHQQPWQQQQQQQQPRPSLGLKPPPSATTNIALLGSNSSSSHQDPFAGLAGPGGSSNIGSRAAGGASSGFDPFSSLAAAPAAAPKGSSDPFAGLMVHRNSQSLNAARQQRPQQQQWPASGGGGSLI